MEATSLITSAYEGAVSAFDDATVRRTRWWETAYTTVNWEYPPSPAAYYEALLSRGALHSRFLRIAYLSTRERLSSAPLSLSPISTVDDTPSPSTPAYLTSTPLQKPSVRLSPTPPYPLSRPCVNVRPRFANPASHVLKRRKPQWPKPPHYHASLLRSPLSRRKGLFRAVLPPNKAVDFFRWDVLLGVGVSVSAPCLGRDRARRGEDACAPHLVAESVLEPYEAAAGFFGWHGVGLGVVQRVEGRDDEGDCCWGDGVEVCRLGTHGRGVRRLPDLQLGIDEATVEEGRARWARMAEELVGPPGLVMRWVIEDGRMGKITVPLVPGHKDAVDSRVVSSISSRREEVRWDSGIDTSVSRPPRSTSVSEKRQSPPLGLAAGGPGLSSGSNLEPKTDLPSAWWYRPSPHRGVPPTPRLPSFRFPPPQSVQLGPPLPFPAWFPPGRVASAHGHGYWYGAQPTGAPSVNRDPNLHAPHPHVFATPVAPTSMHPPQSPRYPLGPGHDCDKETETDHGYESTTTTTDSDPPPHTPIGAMTTSHCVEALQVHGDDEVDVEIDADHAAASMTVGLSDPTTPVKFLGRFSMSTPPSVSSYERGSDRDGYGSSKSTVVFPSLNGSFRQELLSQTSVVTSGRRMYAQTTPEGTVTPVSSSSLSSAKESTRVVEENVKVKGKTGGAGSVSGDSPAFMLSLSSPPPTSPSPGLRKDSQGFWEPVTPASPSSSSSSLLLSPTEGKARSRPTVGWIGEQAGSRAGESPESSEASSQFTFSVKSRSLSPGPRRVTSAGSTRSSSSRPSFSSPTSTPASTSVFGGSYPSSPSPPVNSNLVTPGPTTLLPAFLATTSVKRKKTSRTREIVDRLRSSSIDAGKGGVGLDGSGWVAGSTAGELDGAVGKATSAGDHTAGSQSSPSPPSKSSSESGLWLGSGLGKNSGLAPGSKAGDADSVGTGKGGEATQVVGADSESIFLRASAGTTSTTANTSVTPFPILSVSQGLAPNFSVQQGKNGSANGRELAGTTASKNAGITTSPSTRASGPQLLHGTPNGGTSPSAHHPLHPLPSPSHSTLHPQPPLGPPPALAVSPYPSSMYVPFTPYHIAPPPYQGQQGQGTWLAVYPSRPPHLPVHPLPAQTHVAPITGMSGMRHVSW